MRYFHRFALVMCLIFMVSGLTRASEYHVPQSWELIANSQEAQITDMAIKGKWLVWFEKELYPTNGPTVPIVRSYFVRLYRKNIDSNEIETLYAPDHPESSGEHFVLGPNGVTTYDNRGRWNQTLFIPGQDAPYQFPRKDNYNGNENETLKICNDVLLCKVDKDLKTLISIIPFKDRKPDFENKIILSEHVRVNRDAYPSLFWNGKYLLYTTENWKGPIELFDVKENKSIWTVEKKDNLGVLPVGLTNDYAYYCEQSRVYINLGESTTTGGNYRKLLDIFYRISTQKIDALEKITIPLQLLCLIDYYPERLLGIIKTQDEYQIVEINFESGLISKYDIVLPAPLGVGPHENLSDIIDVGEASKTNEGLHYSGFRLPDPRLFSITGDAESGKLIVLVVNNIYKVSQTQSNKIEGLEWKPVKEESNK